MIIRSPSFPRPSGIQYHLVLTKELTAAVMSMSTWFRLRMRVLRWWRLPIIPRVNVSRCGHRRMSINIWRTIHLWLMAWLLHWRRTLLRRWVADGSVRPATAKRFLLLRPVLGQRADDGTSHGPKEGMAGLFADVSASEAAADGSEDASFAFGGRVCIVLWVPGGC